MREHITEQFQKSKEKKAAIQTVAMGMFSEYGYEQTTIRDICKKAGITTGSFYNYFGDKLGVLLQFLYDILEKGSKHIAPTPENLAHPYQSVCNYFIAMSSYMDHFSRDVACQAILNIPRLITGAYKTLSQDSSIRDISSFLDAAKETGTIPSTTDTTAVSEYLLSSANGIALSWLTISPNESYLSVATRLMPTFFSAVTDERICVHPEITE